MNSMSSVGASGGTGRLCGDGRARVHMVGDEQCAVDHSETPASGQGDGGVEYVVAANPNPESRRGTVVVGGQVFEVAQEGLPASSSLRPNSQNVEAEGGSGSFTVEGPEGCNWTPAASDEWITITNGGSRTGTTPSTSLSLVMRVPRNGTIRVGGQVFSISSRRRSAAINCLR